MKAPILAPAVLPVLAAISAVPAATLAGAANTPPAGYLHNDSHFHATNYVRAGTDVRDHVARMVNVVGRSTLFGLPPQQMGQYGVGMNFYPFDTRNHRLNLQLLDVDKSPVSSAFGCYTGGEEGLTAATSFSIFF